MPIAIERRPIILVITTIIIIVLAAVVDGDGEIRPIEKKSIFDMVLVINTRPYFNATAYKPDANGQFDYHRVLVGIHDGTAALGEFVGSFFKRHSIGNDATRMAIVSAGVFQQPMKVIGTRTTLKMLGESKSEEEIREIVSTLRIDKASYLQLHVDNAKEHVYDEQLLGLQATEEVFGKPDDRLAVPNIAVLLAIAVDGMLNPTFAQNIPGFAVKILASNFAEAKPSIIFATDTGYRVEKPSFDDAAIELANALTDFTAQCPTPMSTVCFFAEEKQSGCRREITYGNGDHCTTSGVIVEACEPESCTENCNKAIEWQCNCTSNKKRIAVRNTTEANQRFYKYCQPVPEGKGGECGCPTTDPPRSGFAAWLIAVIVIVLFFFLLGVGLGIFCLTRTVRRRRRARKMTSASKKKQDSKKPPRYFERKPPPPPPRKPKTPPPKPIAIVAVKSDLSRPSLYGRTGSQNTNRSFLARLKDQKRDERPEILPPPRLVPPKQPIDIVLMSDRGGRHSKTADPKSMQSTAPRDRASKTADPKTMPSSIGADKRSRTADPKSMPTTVESKPSVIKPRRRGGGGGDRSESSSTGSVVNSRKKNVVVGKKKTPMGKKKSSDDGTGSTETTTRPTRSTEKTKSSKTKTLITSASG